MQVPGRVITAIICLSADPPEWLPTQRAVIGEFPRLPEGRQIDRSKLPILAAGFVDALRDAGVEIPIGATLLYVRALAAVNDLNRAARYWCGRTTLITRQEDFAVYHRVFGSYWVGAAAGAFAAAMERTDGPTMLLLTRQNLPNQNAIPVAERRGGTYVGGYIAVKETADLETIIIATGSELQHAIEAAKELGAGCRVVSMPCQERFDRQPQDYRDEILPPACTKRIAIEAGVSHTWYKYVGTEGKIIGIDRFGISAPANLVFEELGITPENIVATAKA